MGLCAFSAHVFNIYYVHIYKAGSLTQLQNQHTDFAVAIHLNWANFLFHCP